MKKVKHLMLLLFIALVSIIGMRTPKALDPFYNITSIFLKNDEVVFGQPLYVDIMGQKNYKSIVIYLCDDSHNCYGFDVKNVNSSNSYLDMSNPDLKVGKTYSLSTAYVMDDKGDITYSFHPNTKNPYMNPMGKNKVKIVEEEKYINLDISTTGVVVEPNGKLEFDIDTNYDINSVSVCLRNKYIPTINSIVYLNKNVESVHYDAFLTRGSSILTDGEYYVSDIFLTTNDNKSVHYSSYSTGTDVLELKNNTALFTIKSTNSSTITEDVKVSNVLNSITLEKETLKLNEKVLLDINASIKLASATLIFSNSTESITVNVKDLDSKPYFVVPFTTSAGEYDLDYAILKDLNGNEYQFRNGTDYSKVKHFDFNSSIIVENDVAEGDILSIDNSKMSFEIINKLKELDNNLLIEINAEDNPIISEYLFDTIKGSNKTVQIKYKDFEWIFNGLDIKNVKQIDVSSSIYNVDEDDNISSKVKSGLVLDFADNEKLPGKCLIKLYNSNIISDILGNKDANIYYYNEKEDKFEEIKLNSEYNTDGYYEFYIQHNSKYVITTDKLSKKYVKHTSNSNSNMKDTLLLSIPIAAALVVGAFIIRSKRKSSM